MNKVIMMICQNFIKTHSSCVNAVRFIPQKKALDIKFPSGHIYRYYGVKYKTFVELLWANSLGKYFSSNIRNKYKYEKLS